MVAATCMFSTIILFCFNNIICFLRKVIGLSSLMKKIMKGHLEGIKEIREESQGYEMYHPMTVKWMKRRCSNMEPRVL